MLGDRVEREHGQHLRDHRRIEQQTSSSTSQTAVNADGELNFEELVVGNGANKPPFAVNGSSNAPRSTPWEEADPWDSIFAEAGNVVSSQLVSYELH